MSANNGTRPDPAAQAQAAAEAFCYANYPGVAGQLAAVCTILSMVPIDALLVANKRMQSVSVLTLPGNVTAEQAAAHQRSLKADQAVIEAAIALMLAVKAGAMR